MDTKLVNKEILSRWLQSIRYMKGKQPPLGDVLTIQQLSIFMGIHNTLLIKASLGEIDERLHNRLSHVYTRWVNGEVVFMKSEKGWCIEYPENPVPRQSKDSRQTAYIDIQIGSRKPRMKFRKEI
jgi:hypothetical protein